MKVWLDDIRLCPDGFTWAKTAQEAIAFLMTKEVTDISLDHDLGDETLVGSGYTVAKYIEEAAFNDSIPPVKWNLHTQNSVGRINMRQALINADKYWGLTF